MLKLQCAIPLAKTGGDPTSPARAPAGRSGLFLGKIRTWDRNLEKTLKLKKGA